MVPFYASIVKGRQNVKETGNFYLGIDVNDLYCKVVGIACTIQCYGHNYKIVSHVQLETYKPVEIFYLTTSKNNLRYCTPMV